MSRAYRASRTAQGLRWCENRCRYRKEGAVSSDPCRGCYGVLLRCV